MTERKLQWEDKHDPTILSEMILDEETRNYFTSQLKHGDLSSMTLHGIQGIGKTTIAKMLPYMLGEDNCETMFIDCSRDNSIDMVRGKITDFCEANFNGKIKIVIIDEADSLSGTSSGTETSSAQKALKGVMTTYKDTRFILTCNVIGLMNPAIQSRCTPIKLKFNTKDVLKRCIDILKAEEIIYDKENVGKFFIDVITPNFPDVRSIVKQLQMWSVTGTLQAVQACSIQKEVDVFAQEIIIKMQSSVPEKTIRAFYIENSEKFSSDYEKLSGSLFNLLGTKPKAQIMISESIYNMQNVIDREIQFYASILRIYDDMQPRVITG